ncbi:MAG: ribonuclease III [Clostridia bacterium]|nr:ribonuclease III [Clostridia bacterium]
MSIYTELESTIGYSFNNRDYLKQALCHSSYANESRDKGVVCNERLEFLGDSVLSLVVSNYLFNEYPTMDEGRLSSIRREIVDSSSLAGYARRIKLGQYMMFGHGEEQSGGREKQKNLEDAFEALIAAIYLDGGIEPARTFVLSFAIETSNSIVVQHKFSDPKSKLQEIVQRGGGEPPVYKITSESGPDHDKKFECDVLVENNVMGHGSGSSKKEAEKMAAEHALEYFGSIEK